MDTSAQQQALKAPKQVSTSNESLETKNAFFDGIAANGGDQISFDIDKNHIDTVESARSKAIEQVRQIKSKPYEQRSRTENGMLAYYRREYGDLDKLIAPEPAPPKSKNDIIQELLNKPEAELSKEEFYMVNSHKHNIKKQTDKIINNVTRDIKAGQDLVAATLLDADPLEGEQLDMFSRLSGVNIDQDTRGVYASLFDEADRQHKLKIRTDAANEKEAKLLGKMNVQQKAIHNELLDRNISKVQLMDAVGDDIDGSRAILKSIRRNERKRGVINAAKDADYKRLLMPISFDEHVMRTRKNMSVMDHIRTLHMKTKGLESTSVRVARARQSVGAKIPKEMEKKLIKKGVVDDGSAGATLSHALKGNKNAMIGGVFSGVMAISDYKDSRREGKTVIESAGSAAFEFAKGEILGMKGMLALGAVKGIPKLAVGAYNEVQSINRSMNNLQRFTPFSDSQFADTQQLATMRQSGMEMAKMANYNLQQTLMGTEAKYLHR